MTTRAGRKRPAIPLLTLLAVSVVFGHSAVGGRGGRAVAAAPPPTVSKPHPFARQTDAGQQFVQVAAHSTQAYPGLAASVNGIETKIAHESPIVAPNADASYSFSAGAYTTTGYWLQMGSIVLGSDGGGLARWFVQVLNCGSATATTACTTVYWKLSRAGEANPPPACSACSGDAGTGGYPYAFTSDGSGTWTFWFDGLTKAKVSLGAANRTVDPSQVYFLGEVTAASNVTSNIMGPRHTIRTLRLWSTSAGAWAEAQSAQAEYYLNPSACPYGIASLGLVFDTYTGTSYHAVKAGSTVACPPTGILLWP